jgi:flavorubredoxin
MSPNVTEIAADVFRISTFHPEFAIQFNQFLVADDEPFLMHTGMKKMFSTTIEGVASILDPAKLRWIGFSHFESDECGALNEWLENRASGAGRLQFRRRHRDGQRLRRSTGACVIRR